MVTGATRGIGRAIALALAGAGANIVVNYKNNNDDSKDVCNKIRNAGRQAIAVRADMAKCVLFLASDDSSYITGQIIHVSGGLVMP